MRDKIFVPLYGMPKYVVGFLGTLVFRLVTPYLGLWNISPLMATELAGSKAYGPWVAGVYGFFSMVLLDTLMGKAGSWTIVTSITYAVVGVLGAWFFRGRKASASNFVLVSIFGTLFFDVITGVLMGPMVYGQPWAQAIIGQIPFTLRHLVGNVFFAIILAPWFYRVIMSNPKWEIRKIFSLA